jgi:hypothetical protein
MSDKVERTPAKDPLKENKNIVIIAILAIVVAVAALLFSLRAMSVANSVRATNGTGTSSTAPETGAGAAN